MHGTKMEHISPAPWSEKIVKVHRDPKESSADASAKEAIYESGGTITVTAFVAPRSGIVWVGPEQDFYLEIQSGIVGAKLQGGFVVWCESLITKKEDIPSAEGLADAIARFETQIGLAELREAESAGDRESRRERITDLRPVFKPGFFFASVYASNWGEVRIAGVEVIGDKVRLDIENLTSKRAGSAWINIESRCVVRAIEGDEETFPRLTPWKETKIKVDRTNQASPSTIAAKRTVHAYDHFDSIKKIPITAFVIADSGVAWVGPDQDFYIETGPGILGVRLDQKHLLWGESVIEEMTNLFKGKAVDDAIHLFETHFDVSKLRDTWMSGGFRGSTLPRDTDLSEVFNPSFFAVGENNPRLGEAKIVDVKVSGDELRLDVKSLPSNRSGSVWINIESRKLIRASEGGQQTFPK